MTEFRDWSRLPADRSYWDSLESKITGELGPLVRAVGARSPVWWRPLARRAWLLGGLAAAAALGALWLLPSRSSGAAANPAGLLHLPSQDPALVAFVSAPGPPAAATLALIAASEP